MAYQGDAKHVLLEDKIKSLRGLEILPDVWLWWTNRVCESQCDPRQPPVQSPVQQACSNSLSSHLRVSVTPMTKWPRCNVRLNLLFISDQAVIEKLSIKPLIFSLLCTTEHLVHVRLIKAKRGDFASSSRRKPDSLCHEPYELSISARFHSQFCLQPYVSYHHAAFLCCLFGG